MKKLFSLVLAVAMVLSMACFASAEENTTLTIVAWDVGTTPYYQAQKEAFEATHPGVTIEYVDVASQDWDTKAGTMLSGGSGNIIGTLFGVISLSTIKNIVSSLGLDDAWWTNITVAAMICLFLVIQSVVLSRKNKKKA